MTAAMHIGSHEINQPAFYQPFGHPLLLLTVISSKAQQINLEHRAGIMDHIITRPVIIVIRISFRVRQYRLEPPHLQIEQGLVEVPRLLHERVLDKQMPPWQRAQFPRLELLPEKTVKAVFG